MTIRQLFNKHNISTYVCHNTPEKPYRAVFSNGRYKINLVHHTKEIPDLEEVFRKMVADGMAFECNPQYLDFCTTLGLTVREARSLRIYRRCKETQRMLKRLLGDNYADFARVH